MLFLKRQSVGLRASLLASACLLLMYAGPRSHSVSLLHSYLVNAAAPVFSWSNAPSKFFHTLKVRWLSGAALQQDNQQLRQQQLLLQAKLLRLQALQLENAELRALLKSASQAMSQLKVADVVAMSPDPFIHEWVLNKGKSNAVFVGQPVLGAQGVLGQVIASTPHRSRLLLLIDPRSAIPVQNSRTGLRALVKGTGAQQRVQLMHVPQTADVKVGDLWLTSGLGLRYPSGYPVAITVSVARPEGQPFALIQAAPSNPLFRQHHVLLMWPASTHLNADAPVKAKQDEQPQLAEGLR